jgi:FtsZ-interacting cell division protein ZipA
MGSYYVQIYNLVRLRPFTSTSALPGISSETKKNRSPLDGVEPVDGKKAGSSKEKTAGSSDNKTAEPSDDKTAETSDDQPAGTSNGRLAETSHSQAAETSADKPAETPDEKKDESSHGQPAETSDDRPTEASDEQKDEPSEEQTAAATARKRELSNRSTSSGVPSRPVSKRVKIDTAGPRTAEERVEIMGVERAEQRAEVAEERARVAEEKLCAAEVIEAELRAKEESILKACILLRKLHTALS